MQSSVPTPSTTPFASSEPLDLVLRGGTVLDGLGGPPVRADVGVRNGRIAAMGNLEGAQTGRVLDCADWFVAPGFVDIHTHSDLSVLFTPGMESSLAQGVTSEVVGNCGFAVGLAQSGEAFAQEQRFLAGGGVALDWNDLAGFLHRIEDNGIAINVATLAGHGTLRKRVVGNVARLLDAREAAQMRRELEDALEAGAVGLSSGLEYVPGMYADVAELTDLARITKQAGGFYATHLRDEGDQLEEAVAEAIAVAEGAGIALQLSHHKAEKPRNWGKITRTLKEVSAARERGVDILLDQYPYTAYQTALATIVLPPWAVGGTPHETATRLRDPETRASVWATMEFDGHALELTGCPHHREWQGRTIADLAHEHGRDTRDMVLDILADADGFVSAAHFALSETDVESIMRDERVMIASDGVAAHPPETATPDEGRPHPRAYGTFGRVLGRYVREKNLLTWPEAIRRMTSLPASRLGWTDRGRIAPGMWADICVFDPSRIGDTATFANPHSYAVGVEYVLVEGTVALERGVFSGTRSGRVLRRLENS